MVVPAFGFGVGDFVTGISLINKAAKALRSTGGAASSYQRTASELSNLADLLGRLQALERTAVNASIVDQIQICTLSCKASLQQLLDDLRKFEPWLSSSPAVAGHGRVKPWLPSTARKVQWAVVVEADVARLKASIQPQLQTIDILLQLASLQQVVESQQTTNETRQYAERLLETVNHLKQDLGTKIATSQQVTDLIPLIANLATPLTGKLQESVETSKAVESATMELNAKALIQEDLLRDILQRLKSDQLRSEEHMLRIQSPRPLNTSDIRGLYPGTLHDGSNPIDAAIFHFHLLLVNLRVATTEVILLLLLLLAPVQRYLRGVARSTSALMRVPTLLLDNNIQLEDVLGRTMSLAYEDFRYWPVLKARLREAFKGLPGENQVRDNHFHIINMSSAGNLVFTKKNWHRVMPGAKLAMSIMFPNTMFDETKCPRCKLGEFDAGNDQWVMCDNSTCRLSWRVLFQPTDRGHPDDDPTIDYDYIWAQLKSMNTLPKDSDLDHFRRVHVIGQSFRRLQLPERLFEEHVAFRQDHDVTQARHWSALLDQHDENQLQTMSEAMEKEMRKMVAHWSPLYTSPLYTMSKWDATS